MLILFNPVNRHKLSKILFGELMKVKCTNPLFLVVTIYVYLICIFRLMLADMAIFHKYYILQIHFRYPNL